MAWNDPQWGNKDNRKNSGPPDLDELWKRLNERLNGLFGGKRGGNDGGDRFPGGGAAGGGNLIGGLACQRLLYRRYRPAWRGAAVWAIR